MRILHVTPYFAPAFRYGGPPQSILGLCHGLQAAGVDVEVLTTTANANDEISNDLVQRAEYEGVPVRYLPACFPRGHFNAKGLSATLREMLPGVDLAHVHGLWSFPAWIASRECNRASVPFVVSPRGMLDDGSLQHHRWRKKIAYWMWERNYLRKAAFLHATSPGEVESLERLSLGPRIVRLPNGVSPPSSEPETRFRDELGLGADDPVALFLGRLHPMKRLDLLLAAFDLVRKRLHAARLVLAGPQDGLDAESLIRRSSDPSAVTWIGEVAAEDKWSLLSEADVLVTCSDSESFGMSVVEAMAVGTAIVTTRTCPWQEVETEGAGFWVPQRAEDIADAIFKVLRCRAKADAMGECGRQLVHKRYRWTEIAEKMSMCYENVMA